MSAARFEADKSHAPDSLPVSSADPAVEIRKWIAAPMTEHQLSVGDWAAFRELMPISKKWSYFDHAAVAPLSTPALAAIQQWSRQAVEEGDTVWPAWAKRVEAVRQTAANIINAHTHEIAIVPNTTTGIGLVAEGFPWQQGDNLVTLANEFPSNVYPWMNLAARGVETRLVEPDGVAVHVDRILDKCDARTRIITVSWVGFATGWRIDVHALVEAAHARGILVFLDAIQGLGVFPLNVATTSVDFLAADGHKWMLGPEGAGFLFVRRTHLERLRPLNVGWNSVVHSHDFSRIELNVRAEAARYEGGSQNMIGVHALGASLEMLCQLGLSFTQSRLADRIIEITDLACARLQDIGAQIASPRDESHRSNIVAFELPGRSPDQVRRHCLERGVALGCRGGRLRISPHAYNNEQDVERLIDSLGP